MAASIKSKLSEYKETVETYLVGKIADGVETKNINFGRTDEDGNLVDKSIKEVITNVDEFYEARLIIMHGELYYCYKANEGESATDEIPTYASQMGIKVISYGDFVYDGETSVYASLKTAASEGTYYMCTPDLSGFNADCTYYVSYEDINNVNTLKILNKISGVYTYKNEWYDYPQKNWANVLTTNNGTMTYWVWIPRFAYSESSMVKSENEIQDMIDNSTDSNVKDYSNLDIIFINTDDEYWDEGKNEFVKISELEEKYIVPDAFNFDGQSRGGYWMSKYEVQDNSKDNGDFIITASTDAFCIKTSDSTNTVSYKVYIDGEAESNLEYTGTLDSSKVITTIGGNKITQNTPHLITIFDNYNVRKWTQTVYTLSYQDKTEIASNINIDISSFDEDNTYFVLYDKDGTNPELIPFKSGGTTVDTTSMETINEYIDSKKSTGYYWYNYGNLGQDNVAKIWANIATTSNNTLTFWTYIPRYAISQLGGEDSTSFDVRFVNTSVTNETIKNGTASVKGTSDDSALSLTGYYIPAAFTFDDKERNGYWMSKYEVQAKDNHPDYTAIVDSGKITVKGFISATDTIFGVKQYTVEITDSSGNKINTTLSNNSYVTTSTLTSGAKYTIKVYTVLNAKAEGKSIDAKILSWETELTLSSGSGLANVKVDLTGYVDANTKIVLYNSSMEKTEKSLSELKAKTWDAGSWSGNIFTSSAGKGTITIDGTLWTWFDYNNKIWANIVTTGSGTTTYWTYIPRYEYKIDEYGGTSINFITTESTKTTGYTIPDAFNFDSKKRNGYWMSKYEVQAK